MYVNTWSILGGDVRILAGGTAPCLLLPQHQAPSQGLEAHCFHDKLVLASVSHTPAAAGGSFSSLNPLLFQKGESV